MKVSELRKLSIEELTEKLVETENEQLKMRSNLTTKQLENTSLLRSGRKNIARIYTIINEKKKEAKNEVST